jgi:hypothetical protein
MALAIIGPESVTKALTTPIIYTNSYAVHVFRSIANGARNDDGAALCVLYAANELEDVVYRHRLVWGLRATTFK